MLRFINLFQTNNRGVVILLLASVFSTGASSERINVNYEITWNKISLGKVSWNLFLDSNEYSLEIILENYGVSSKLFPFYGEHFSKGEVNEGIYVPNKYYQIWNTKKKNRSINVLFKNRRIDFFEIIPKEAVGPRINFYNLDSVVDPLSAVLTIITKNRPLVVNNVFDGRRVYSLSTENMRLENNYNISGFNSLFRQNLIISKYRNIWKDHNKKDLKKVEIVTGKTESGLTLPLYFKIISKGLVFKINYINSSL